MAFVKLDCGILDSSVWPDRDARDVWLTALLMATPTDLPAPVEILGIDSGEPEGWQVAAGWYGIVAASSIGICARAQMPIDLAMPALRRLCAPDPHSRSPEHGGRRLARVAGGFIVLNWARYRDRDHGAAERSRRWRARQVAARRERDATHGAT